MIALNVEQGSSEWLEARLGVISASNVGKVLAKKGTETRHGYMMELIGQIATKEAEEIFAKSLEWGKTHEPVARSIYEFNQNVAVEDVGFFYGPDKRTGCSPDGWITKQAKGLEIKCPITAKVHADFLTMDKIKLDYFYQIQFGMFVTGAELWDFCSYHGKFKAPGTQFKVLTIERDPALMERFANDVGEFIADMDKLLNKLELQWGSQWT